MWACWLFQSSDAAAECKLYDFCVYVLTADSYEHSWNRGRDEGTRITGAECIYISPLSTKSPSCIPPPSCVVLACSDGWELKDANVHVGAADLPQRLTLHHWKWKPVNQRAAVALIPTHHSLWHCQMGQDHINHKHRLQHCAVDSAVSHPFIHLALTLTQTRYIQYKWWDVHAQKSYPKNPNIISHMQEKQMSHKPYFINKNMF